MHRLSSSRRLSVLLLLATLLAAQLLLSAHESAHALSSEPLQCALCLHAPQIKSGVDAGAAPLPQAAVHARNPAPATPLPAQRATAPYRARAPPLAMTA